MSAQQGVGAVGVDRIENGMASGSVAETLLANGMDPGALRPYIAEDNRGYITANHGKSMVPTANALLRKDEWAQFDTAVLKAARTRLRAWSDLSAASSFSMNGMNSMVLEHETMSDPGEAFTSFSGITEGRADAPQFQIEGLPLPITHCDFWFDARRLNISRTLGSPLDSAMAEAAGRRVAERIEKTLIGSVAGESLSPADRTYGSTPTVYGYTNFPDRITKTDMTAGSAGGWTGAVLVAEVLDLMESLYDKNHYGPFMLYHSRDWTKYMDQDYSADKGDNTVRDRLKKIDGISDVRRLDLLSNTFTIILVQMTSEVARAVNGMNMTTVRWEGQGGMRLYFKVMAIQVPQLRSDYNGFTGIAHGTTA